MARPPPNKLAKEEVVHHNLTHVVFRNMCSRCVVMRAREQPHHLTRADEDIPKVMLDWMFFTTSAGTDLNYVYWFVYDIVSSVVMAIQASRHDDPRILNAVVQTVNPQQEHRTSCSTAKNTEPFRDLGQHILIRLTSMHALAISEARLVQANCGQQDPIINALCLTWRVVCLSMHQKPPNKHFTGASLDFAPT